MDPVQIAVFAAAIPAGVAAAVFLLIRRLRGGGETPTDAGPAVALGFVAGFAGIAGLPSFPVLDAWKWLFFIGLAGGVLAVIASRVTDPPEAIRWTLRVVLAAFAAWATVGWKSAAWVGGAFAATMALVWFADRLARRAGASTFLATMLVVATAAAVSAERSHSGTLAQLCGALCAAMGACLVVSWFVPAAVRGSVALVAVLLAAMILNELVSTDLPVASAALLAAAAPAAWGANCLLSSLSAHRRSALSLAVAVLFAGTAVSIAVSNAASLDY